MTNPPTAAEDVCGSNTNSHRTILHRNNAQDKHMVHKRANKGQDHGTLSRRLGVAIFSNQALLLRQSRTFAFRQR